MQRAGQIETYRFSRRPATGRAIPLSIFGGKKEISRHRCSSDWLPRENGRRRNAQMQDYLACRSELVIIPRRAGKPEIRSAHSRSGDPVPMVRIRWQRRRRGRDTPLRRRRACGRRHEGRSARGPRERGCRHAEADIFMHVFARFPDAYCGLRASRARARAHAGKCCIAIVHVHTYGSLHRSRYSR
jgi:hypothetical protein